MFAYVKPIRNLQESLGTPRNPPRNPRGTPGIPFALFQTTDLVESVDRVVGSSRVCEGLCGGRRPEASG